MSTQTAATAATPCTLVLRTCFWLSGIYRLRCHLQVSPLESLPTAAITHSHASLPPAFCLFIYQFAYGWRMSFTSSVHCWWASVGCHHQLHHLLLSRHVRWFHILVPAYTGCPRRWPFKRVLVVNYLTAKLQRYTERMLIKLSLNAIHETYHDECSISL